MSNFMINTVAASAAVIMLQGCSSDSGSKQDSLLGQPCDPDAVGTCGQGQEDPSDFSCQTDPNTQESYCTESCTEGSLGACGAGQQGSTGDYTCQADSDGDFFCFEDPDAPPPSEVKLGDPCTDEPGACGSGEEGSDWECRNNECTEKCEKGDLGACGAGQQGSTGDWECGDSGYCERTSDPEPTTKLGDECNTQFRGTCGQGQQGGSDFECIQDEANVEYCTTKCVKNGQPLMGACGLGRADSTDEFFCNETTGYCEKTSSKPTPSGTKLGDSCNPKNKAGLCGAGTASGTNFVCKRAGEFFQDVCTESCDPKVLGSCNQGTEGGSNYSCKKAWGTNDYYCFA